MGMKLLKCTKDIESKKKKLQNELKHMSTFSKVHDYESLKYYFTRSAK